MRDMQIGAEDGSGGNLGFALCFHVAFTRGGFVGRQRRQVIHSVSSNIPSTVASSPVPPRSIYSKVVFMSYKMGTAGTEYPPLPPS